MTLKKPSHLFGKGQNINESVENTPSRPEKNQVSVPQNMGQFSFSNVMDGVFKDINEQIHNLTSEQIKDIQDDVLKIAEVVDQLVDKELPKVRKLSTTAELRVESRISELKEDLYKVLENHIKETKDTVRASVKIQEERQKESEKIEKLSRDLEAVERYISRHSNDITNLKEEVYKELEKTNLNIPKIEEKIGQINESYETLSESLLNQPETKTEDPLTPLNQDFVTVEDLNKHYNTFLNRVQEQLATVGGGGEVRLKWMDDIVGIATNASAYDGMYLKYDHSIGKFVFESISGGGVVGTAGTWAVDAVGINTTKSVGIGTDAQSGYQLYVEGDARVTGILTVGPASITLDGINNEVYVGTGITMYGNAGIISATKFYAGGVEVSGSGSQGIQGIQGDLGGTGVQGSVGTQGTDGAAAAQGIQGTQGITGEQGVQGIQGESVQGSQGIQGDSGATGGPGSQGIQGITGDAGPQGIQGTDGPLGLQGSTGNQGTQGITGAGTQGTTGTQGTDGTQGNQGLQGIQGSDATVQGIQGIQGPAGTGGEGGAGYWEQTVVGINTISNVGIATTNPLTPLQIEEVYGVKTGIGTFNSVVGVTADLDSFDTSSLNFQTAEYTINVGFGTYIQSQKVLVMQNGTTAYSQEYAVMYNPELVVSIGATMTGTTCKLQATPETGITGLTTYRFVRTTLL